jgi:hypothetical protein
VIVTPAQQADATLIQIAFDSRLNYHFVLNTTSSPNQIFTFLPQGIAYALGIPPNQVNMSAIKPYDTSASLGYITTLAMAWIPSKLVNELQMDIHLPSSKAYTNPDSSVNTLMSMINPTIPILAGAGTGAAAPTGYNNAAATGGANAPGSGGPVGGDIGTSAPINGRSAAIGVGAVAGAAVYAAAMFYVARRYRNKRNSHQRSSSVGSADRGEMSQRYSSGGLFMAGGSGRAASRQSDGSGSQGRSVREQGISAPILSENSLGWN